MNRYDYLKNSHDLLSLSDWGPFARDLYGLSHIAHREKGLKFDFFFVPGILRRKFFLPETLRESGCSPLEAAADLSYFSFRQQMEGMDKLYADVSYSRIGEDLWLGRCEFVNNTDQLRGMSLLAYARLSPRPEVFPVLPEGARWTDALAYAEIRYASPRFDHNLTFAGGRRGEEQYPGTVGTRCVGRPYYGRPLPCFGAEKGDRIRYRLSGGTEEEKLFLRYRIDAEETLQMECRINGKSRSFTLRGTGKFELLALGVLPAGEEREIELISASGSAGIRLDGFVTGGQTLSETEIRFEPIGRTVRPKAVPGPMPETTLFSGENLSGTYGMWRSMKAGVERDYWTGDLAKLVNYSYGLRQVLYKDIQEYPGDEYCHDAYMVPVTAEARSSTVIHMLISRGADPEGAGRKLAETDRSFAALEQAYREAEKRAIRFDPAPGGESYEFTQKITAATCLTNLNFPIQARGKNIRHHVPDKYFNTLYSWDSGFIGLGFLELDRIRAIENLNVYVTEPEDEENAFLLRGTPLPVQAYLYAEIWNRYQDREMLEFFYPRLRHFYDFISGHIPTSTFRTAKSGLLRSWDYFYNSGGWDDYPPQWYIRDFHCREMAPAVTTAHAIRFAKILRRAAAELEKTGDLAFFDADISAFANALQTYSWSKEDGVFSYVKHDAQGNPTGFWMDPGSGVNFNLGMDGLSPLVSGICTGKQKEKMFRRLEDPEGMWTDIGISTVDRRAPYYRTDGYWNGCVWMPHQWFFWKSALDDNRSRFAWKIADTALRLWHNEVRLSRYTFEHFSMVSKRGAGCCHFGGLSSPVLNWYGAYFKKGRITAGFDTWIRSQSVSGDRMEADLLIDGDPLEKCALLFVTGGGNWEGTYAGENVEVENVTESTVSAALPKGSSGKLILKRK